MTTRLLVVAISLLLVELGYTDPDVDGKIEQSGEFPKLERQKQKDITWSNKKMFGGLFRGVDDDVLANLKFPDVYYRLLYAPPTEDNVFVSVLRPRYQDQAILRTVLFRASPFKSKKDKVTVLYSRDKLISTNAFNMFETNVFNLLRQEEPEPEYLHGFLDGTIVVLEEVFPGTTNVLRTMYAVTSPDADLDMKKTDDESVSDVTINRVNEYRRKFRHVLSFVEQQTGLSQFDSFKRKEIQQKSRSDAAEPRRSD